MHKKNKFKFTEKIDLHGFRKQDAFEILCDFLDKAYESKNIRVLVITGKSGELKTDVPSWLSQNPRFNYIRSIETAHLHDGGEGALYIQLFKKQS
ncbi:MAG: Smr/MutS family protein [Alphaproteobacteria bacterium]|nr:Smr/MutS family protein [Alphaproteobacteria bacterium]